MLQDSLLMRCDGSNESLVQTIMLSDLFQLKRSGNDDPPESKV